MSALKRVWYGLIVRAKAALTGNTLGSIETLSTDNKIHFHNGTSHSPLVSEAHAHTLTNKTIDADSNTITNIEDANIKAGADIARAKLAAGAVSVVPVNDASGVLTDSAVTATELGYLSGVTSAIQTQINAAGTDLSTHEADTSTHGVGTIVGISEAQVLTNKDIDGGTASNANRITLPKETNANITALTRKEATIAYDTTNDVVLVDDGAALTALLKDTDSPAASGSDIAMSVQNGVARFRKLVAGSNVTITENADNIVIASSGGGGGGSGSGSSFGSLIRDLDEDELNSVVVASPNQLIDDFNSDKGTLVDLERVGSALAMSAGGVTGTYERIRNISPTASSISGAVVASLQQIAPKNTALSPSSTSTSVTFTLRGDVTEFFPSGTDVIIANVISSGAGSDDETVGSFLVDATNEVARLTISGAPTYDSGANETEVVISNPDALDLSMGVATGSLNDNLRLIPFDYEFEAKSSSAGSYEAMSVADAYLRQEVRIPGENFFIELAGLTGSVYHMDGAMSPNGQYGFVKMIENAATDTWHFFYYVNGVWSHFATTKAQASSGGTTNEVGGNFHLIARGTTKVANNGLAFATYMFDDGNYTVRGVYSDLSAGTPALSDTPVTGTDSANASGATAGIIGKIAATTVAATGVAMDEVDGSLIAIVLQTSGSVAYTRWFSAGGATHVGLSSASTSQLATTPAMTIISGTSGSHRTTTFTVNNATGNIVATHYDEGSLVAVGTTTVESAGRFPILDVKAQNNRVHVLYNDQSTGSLLYATGTLNGTPSYSAARTLMSASLGGVDSYVGWSSQTSPQQYRNQNKTLGARLVINPADEKHAFAVLDWLHIGDNVRRATLIELRDTTNYLGSQISQYTGSTVRGFYYDSSTEHCAQTFLAASTVVATATFRLSQYGSIPTGHTLYAELQTTSAGAPTGTVVETSVNSYDPSKITKNTSGQLCHFNFNKQSLSGTYAVVLKSTMPVSTSNYLGIINVNSSAYANGAFYYWNGSAYAANGDDAIFEIHGEWIYDVSNAEDSTTSSCGVKLEDQESTISLIDNNNIQIVSRRVAVISDSYRSIAGHPFRRVVSIGSGTTASTITVSKIAGYAENNFDEKLIVNTSLGSDDSASQDVTSGALSATVKGEDRSGFSPPVTYSTATVVTDGDFASGKALEFTTSGSYVSYGAYAPAAVIAGAGKSFVIEAEIKLTTLPSVKGAASIILSTGTNGSSDTALWFNVNASNKLELGHYPASGTSSVTTSTNTLAAGTYYKVKAVSNGSLVSLYIDDVEVSYDAQPAMTAATTATTGQLQIGGYYNTTVYSFGGKIGYVKLAKGVTSFEYEGFKSQPALINVYSTGNRILAESVVGQNSTTNGTNFDNGGIIDGEAEEASVVDSNDVVLLFSHTLGGGNQGKQMNLKLTMGRGSDRNVSTIQGLVFNFDK